MTQFIVNKIKGNFKFSGLALVSTAGCGIADTPVAPSPLFRHMSPMSHDFVFIVDFGSQVTQLIARRVREAGVYCEIHPFSKAGEAFARLKPKAVILSGGPASVPEAESPRAPAEIFKSGVPVLAICYGQQTLCEQLGGRVESGHAAEFGRADVEILELCALFEGVWRTGGRDPVWMSHGDRVTRLPEGFRVLRCRRTRLSRSPPTKRAAITRPCSIPRLCTRPTARSFSPISCSRSRASRATGRWPPSATRRSPASARRWARRA